ncbi:MAG: SWIM zinc finger domain-containing protein [Bacteroidia bacterium]
MHSFEAKELLQLAAPLTVERGQEYFFHNRINKIVQQGDRYRAEVAGSTRYITYLWSEPLSGRCTCPYGGEGACKHIIALGMAILAGQPEPEIWEESVPQGVMPPFQYLSKVNPLARAGVPRRETPLEEMDEVIAAYFSGEEVDLAGLAERLVSNSPEPFFARDMLGHLFEVWQKRLSQEAGKGKEIKMDWANWKPVIDALCVDKMVKHFLQIRIEAYQLKEVFE